MDKLQTIERLKSLGLAPQKMFGQNFLVSTSVAESITRLVINDQSKIIYEIGPGLGALSQHLVKAKKTIKLVEIDHGLAKYLTSEFNHLEHVEVIDLDVLKLSFADQALSVVSNLPYYITTAIIEKVILENKQLVNFVFMVQQEMKERLLASPKSKQYGPLTILLALTGKLEHVINVDRSAFYPVPNVNSSVYSFKLVPHNLEIERMYKFIKALFLMRRKTILNNLNTLVSNKEIREKIINNSGISLNARPEELEPDKFVDLYNNFIALTH